MRVLISGRTGLVGSELGPALEHEGHATIALSRRRGLPGPTVIWDPPQLSAHPASLNGIDAVVHLAGDSIAGGRWTQAKKARIKESRIQGTRSLVSSILSMPSPPKVFISASAVGYYGDRGSEELTESSAPGRGFLPEVCQAWEAESKPLTAKGVRVVNLRFGIILSKKGGALAKMLLPFKLGMGGMIGTGEQWMSWVSLADVVNVMMYALRSSTLKGPVNVTAPESVTNKGFTKTLGKVLHRPTVLPMPAFIARLALGEMADALLLSSARVHPKGLQENGFKFEDPTLEGALKRILGSLVG